MVSYKAFSRPCKFSVLGLFIPHLSQLLATSNLSAVFKVLPFPKCHVLGPKWIACGHLDWLLSLTNTQVSFPWLDGSILFSAE